jgi:hypothetical protein
VTSSSSEEVNVRLKVLIAAAVLGLAAAVPAMATTGKGSLFHDGEIVGTVVNSGTVEPGSGTDPFYAVTNGAEGQLGIAGVAPGDGPYHGGDWAFHAVTFRPGVTPYLLTSDEAVFAAEARGDVTVTRVPENDFRCPVTQP